MANQDKIDEIHQKVTDWSERADEANQSIEDMLEDPEFQEIVEELMEQDMDTLMVLVGKAAQEYGTSSVFEILENGLDQNS